MGEGYIRRQFSASVTVQYKVYGASVHKHSCSQQNSKPAWSSGRLDTSCKMLELELMAELTSLSDLSQTTLNTCTVKSSSEVQKTGVTPMRQFPNLT